MSIAIVELVSKGTADEQLNKYVFNVLKSKYEHSYSRACK